MNLKQITLMLTHTHFKDPGFSEFLYYLHQYIDANWGLDPVTGLEVARQMDKDIPGYYYNWIAKEKKKIRESKESIEQLLLNRFGIDDIKWDE